MTLLRKSLGALLLAAVLIAVSPMLLLVLLIQWLADDWEESWY